MRRTMISCCAILCGMLTAAAPASAAQEKDSLLQEQMLLQSYAWDLQYVQEGPYEINFRMEDDHPVVQYHEELCEAAYQILDFDGDGHPELLTAGLLENEFGGFDYRLCMYEVKDLSVQEADTVSTQVTAIPAEIGMSHVFTCTNTDGELLIGCDSYNLACFLADGVTIKAELYRYDGSGFCPAGNGWMAGSSYTEEEFYKGFEELDIRLPDMKLVCGGELAVYQCAKDSSVILTIENQLDTDYDRYFEWYQGGTDDVYPAGSREYRRNCWLPEDAAN